MNNDYRDITSRIAEEPQWWDEQAVPRYCEFKPIEASNIYASTVVLILIQCQNCKKPFKVCFSETGMSRYQRWRTEQWLNKTIEAEFNDEESARHSLEGLMKKNGFLHYGDPPNYCCGVGATMNSEPQKVLEWWEQDKDPKQIFNGMHGFIRRPELEIEFSDE